MTKPLNNFLETEHVELNKSPMFKGLVQTLNDTARTNDHRQRRTPWRRHL